MKPPNELSGRELDEAVAREVFGGELKPSRPYERWDTPPAQRYVLMVHGKILHWSPHGDWSPSSHIEEAWQVLEGTKSRFWSVRHLSSRFGHDWVLEKDYVKERFRLVYMTPGGDKPGPWSASAEEAICRAALQAVRST